MWLVSENLRLLKHTLFEIWNVNTWSSATVLTFITITVAMISRARQLWNHYFHKSTQLHFYAACNSNISVFNHWYSSCQCMYFVCEETQDTVRSLQTISLRPSSVHRVRAIANDVVNPADVQRKICVHTGRVGGSADDPPRDNASLVPLICDVLLSTNKWSTTITLGNQT